MNFSIVKRIIGYVLVFVAVLMVLPCIVAVIYQEREGWSFVITAALCLLLGFLIMRKKPENRVFYVKEGFVAVALSWIIMRPGRSARLQMNSFAAAGPGTLSWIFPGRALWTAQGSV